MSDPNNPYGPPNPYGEQGGQNPYGPPGGQPAGGQPYGQSYGQGGGFGTPTESPKTDGLSIAALVLSFLCCLAPIGVILGFVGLGRTKGGKRKGRGLAIAAIVVGILMTIGVALGGFLVYVVADSVVTPGNAEVGQCVDIEEEGDTVILTKTECTEDHDGEIIGVAEVTEDNLEAVDEAMVGYCAEVVDADLLVELTSDPTLTIQAVTEDPANIQAGDHLVCYAEGDDLTEKLG